MIELSHDFMLGFVCGCVFSGVAVTLFLIIIDGGFRLEGKRMRRFEMYRRGDLSNSHNELQANKPDEVQFQGVVFDDGTCVIRWLTGCRSTSVWSSFDDMLAIHGHPEYDSELIWLDAENKTQAESEDSVD